MDDLVAAPSDPALAQLRLLRRVREVVSVYFACARLAAATVYADGVLDAVAALGGSREDPPEPIARLVLGQTEAAASLEPLLEDGEARLEEIRNEILDELADSFGSEGRTVREERHAARF
jgi:hypothetical protein